MQATSNVKKEQMRREIRALLDKAETRRKLMEDQEAEREYERACMWKRIYELEDREAQLFAALFEPNLGDDGPNEAEPEGLDDEHDIADEGDITERATWYSSTGLELTASSRNTCWESLERAEKRSEEVGASSWLPGSYGGAASSTPVPPAASMWNGSSDGQSERCPLCFCEFVTQEVGTPEVCKHSFCADCLQRWSKNSNTCPLDRQVYNEISVRRRLGGEVVRRTLVEPPRQLEEDDTVDYVTRCEVCDPVHTLLHCDTCRCGQGCHLECLSLPLDPSPLEEWFCSDCL
jgi:hypothetical protein